MLTDVTRFLANHMATLPGGEEEKLTGALRCLIDTYDLRDIIYSAISDSHRRVVAGQSYHHPNGFTKVVLIAFSPPGVPFELRVHDWQPVPESQSEASLWAEESIHNHGWNFASYVAVGALAFEEYAPSADGCEFEEYAYVRPGSAIGFSLSHVGKARLACTAKGLHRQHSLYYFPVTRYHRTLPLLSERTITILLQGPVVAKQGPITGRIFRDPSHTAKREPPAQRALTEDDLVQTLSAVCDVLQRQSF